LFERVGFERCVDGNPENGYQKIALYVIDNEVQHAARLLDTGDWTSKLGFEGLDMIHSHADTLSGESYGIPEIFMKRERTEPDPEPPSIAALPPNPLGSRSLR
jgi:hypothetical protein